MSSAWQSGCRQPARAIDVRLVHRAGRVGLERQVDEVPALAEAFGERVEVARGAVREGAEHAMRPFEHRARTAEPFRAEARRENAGARRRAGVQALGRGALGEVLDDASGQAACDAERVDDLRRRSAKRRADAGGGSKRAEHAGRMKSRVVDRLGLDQRKPANRFHADRDAQARRFAVAAEAFACGEHRGHDDRTAVDRTAFERVVEVLAMRGGSVDERGIFRAKRLGVADRRAWPAGVERTFHRADVIGVPRGETEADDIEHQPVDLLAHGLGQRLRAQRRDVRSETLGDRSLLRHLTTLMPASCRSP
jgi:hypothetical protein